MMSVKRIGLWMLAMLWPWLPARGEEPPFRLATFTAEVTIPLGHRCMGLLPTKSQRIADPLYAHGLVLLSDEAPIVWCAVDWCEIRNDSYDQWRQRLAEAAGTTRERVLLSSLHQHDAPVVDAGAQQLLDAVGLQDELFERDFHDRTLAGVASAVQASLAEATPITHLGWGQARVEGVASNRRIEYPDGRVTYHRGSRSGADEFMAAAPVGEIDPYLKTISFWHHDRPVAAIHAYATHPMSHYGAGEVSSDFVGLARERRRRDDFRVHQIYVSGCSGDITAGKFNDGSPELRGALIDRIYRGIVAAWDNSEQQPLQQVQFRCAQLVLDYHPDPQLTAEVLAEKLNDATLPVERRIHAAMSLASRQRVAAGRPIDLPCLDFGPVQVVLFPGESFVAYQLMAQRIRPDTFVMSIGYGECWPGYIPTEHAFAEGFTDSWLWTAPGAEGRIEAALRSVLNAD